MSTRAKAIDAPKPTRTVGIPPVALAIAIAVTILQHVTMLYTRHTDGDEAVYSTLAREMNWDLSHYTTQDDPQIKQFPYTCYRHDLFFHPPLYPLVLKTGLAIEPWSVKIGLQSVLIRSFGILPTRISPLPAPLTPPEVTVAAFAFAILVRVSALLVLARLLRRWETPPFASIVVLIAVVVCPITTFSTVRWHHDGLLGLLALIAFALLCESLQTGSRWVFAMGLIAGLAAMNIRYNGIVLAPCFLAVPWFDVFRRWREARTEDAKPSWRQTIQSLPKWWWAFVVVAAVAMLTIGLSHYARVYWRFGTLSPEVINQPSPESVEDLPDESQRELLLSFLKGQEGRTLALFAVETLLLVPVLLLLCHPLFWTGLARDVLRGRERGFILLVALFVGGVLALRLSSQVRYLAAALPMLYLFLAVALETWPVRAWQQAILAVVLATHVFVATTASFMGAQFNSPSEQGNILPTAYLYAPRLQPWVHQAFGNVAEENAPDQSAPAR